MQRIREEMRIAATIRHPNIMRLYGMFIDVDKLGATAYTVREPLGPS
jgi:serine/threonine protein kinase